MTKRVQFSLGIRGRREYLEEIVEIEIDETLSKKEIEKQINEEYQEWLSNVNTGGYQILDENECKYPEIELIIDLRGEDGNSFFLMAKVINAMRDYFKTKGYSNDIIEAIVKNYQIDSMSSNYEHLLQVAKEYISIEYISN